jgi:hypothetical protein
LEIAMHDRSAERALLKRKLEAGRSVHMPAPRRVGKTWTVGHLATDLRADGWHVIESDVEGMRTPAEFARDLCARIESQHSIKDRFKAHSVQRITNLLGGGWGDKPLDALGRIDPIEFAETLIASLDQSGGSTAIIIDEISYFFLVLAEANAREAHAFAYKLRAFQQRYKSVRWLITGSIGLDVIARRHGLEGAFVDFDTVVLEPFTPAEALSYMRDPAIQKTLNHSFDADDADFAAMFSNLGWLAPYYLNLIGNEVRPSVTGAAGSRARATRADLDAAFEKLLQPNRKSAFAVWREHIDKNLPKPDRTVAKHILDFLSKRPNGETEDTLLAQVLHFIGGTNKPQLREILAMLLNDGLLGRPDRRYVFRSGLIRRYWEEYEAE